MRDGLSKIDIEDFDKVLSRHLFTSRSRTRHRITLVSPNLNAQRAGIVFQAAMWELKTH